MRRTILLCLVLCLLPGCGGLDLAATVTVTAPTPTLPPAPTLPPTAASAPQGAAPATLGASGAGGVAIEMVPTTVQAPTSGIMRLEIRAGGMVEGAVYRLVFRYPDGREEVGVGPAKLFWFGTGIFSSWYVEVGDPVGIYTVEVWNPGGTALLATSTFAVTAP